MAADAWSQTLLPAHLQAIAQCWNEALGKAPMAERVKLTNFLSQLRSHFPRWKGAHVSPMLRSRLVTHLSIKLGNYHRSIAGERFSAEE